MPNVQHSSASQLWYTPTDVIEMARAVLGGIGLDPASDATANRTVKAGIFLTHSGENFRLWPHGSSVWLNPPGGVKKGRCIQENESVPALFWKALTDYRAEGLLRHAVFLAFSMEALHVTQRYAVSMMQFPLCIPSKRLRFVSPDGEKNSPTHGSALIYVPGSVDHTADFIRVFSALGACKP
ncbi:MAG TPA: hypothetical protein VFZ61_03790 [Polyangiales bacterium]